MREHHHRRRRDVAVLVGVAHSAVAGSLGDAYPKLEARVVTRRAVRGSLGQEQNLPRLVVHALLNLLPEVTRVNLHGRQRSHVLRTRGGFVLVNQISV